MVAVLFGTHRVVVVVTGGLSRDGWKVIKKKLCKDKLVNLFGNALAC